MDTNMGKFGLWNKIESGAMDVKIVYVGYLKDTLFLSPNIVFLQGLYANISLF